MRRDIIAVSHNVALTGSIVFTIVFILGCEVGKHKERQFYDTLKDESTLKWLHSGAAVGYAAAVAGIPTNRLHAAINEAWNNAQ